MALVAREPFVREHSLEDDRLRLYVDDGASALPELLRLLDREQIGVRSMSVSEPTLDAVFLRETGRSLRDAGVAVGGAAGGGGTGADAAGTAA